MCSLSRGSHPVPSCGIVRDQDQNLDSSWSSQNPVLIASVKHGNLIVRYLQLIHKYRAHSVHNFVHATTFPYIRTAQGFWSQVHNPPEDNGHASEAINKCNLTDAMQDRILAQEGLRWSRFWESLLEIGRHGRFHSNSLELDWEELSNRHTCWVM